MQQGNCPFPTTPEASNQVFNAAGRLFNDSFTYGRSAFSVQVAVGTQTPLSKPAYADHPDATTQDFYEGMFTRIQRAYPIDYYWVWTPEGWEWGHMNASNPVFQEAISDMEAALAGAPGAVAQSCSHAGPGPPPADALV